MFDIEVKNMKNKLALVSLFLLAIPLYSGSNIALASENDGQNTSSISEISLQCKNTASTAYTTWNVYYDDQGINFEVEFTDDDIMINNIYDIGYDDNFEFLINLKSESTSWLIGKTYHFLMSGNGKIYFERVVGPNQIGDRFAKSLGVVLGENLNYSIINHEEGFSAKVFMAYDLLNTTKEEGYGNLSICPAMRNAHIYQKDSTWNYYKSNGCEWSNPSKFVVIK